MTDERCECGHSMGNHYPSYDRCFFGFFVGDKTEKCACTGWRPVKQVNSVAGAVSGTGWHDEPELHPRPQPVLAFCPNCGKEALKAAAWCVSCGVDFGEILRLLDGEMPNLERRLVTVEGKLLTVMSALIRLGVDIR